MQSQGALELLQAAKNQKLIPHIILFPIAIGNI